MAKKAAGGNKSKPKKHAPNAKKKSSQFKALGKQQTRQAVVVSEKKPASSGNQKKPSSRHIPDEFRNFDERMAATSRKQGGIAAANKTVIAPPSFVMAAPTFQFNKPAPAPEPTREVEGFQGFLSAMQNNVFALLDDDDDENKATQQTAAAVPVPTFLRPATFSFQTNPNSASSNGGLTSLQRSLMGLHSASAIAVTSNSNSIAIDPDL
ncbi:hypothetical protein P43SY_000104 [Pythium insidiosum]|uniref:Uncharacterized protein n=1 Tax=Pythium insidiosum TaxID=114742 RepID=A0AAD5Q486_PYTIN|nr:hypothetical protein P43SY_000104 [Pythium insidiosum]